MTLSAFYQYVPVIHKSYLALMIQVYFAPYLHIYELYI